MEAIKYKWQLRKGGRKMKCPRCGQMRFVPYVSAADGRTLAGAMFGRCDREQNCGYIAYPTTDPDPSIEPIVQTPQKPIRFYPAAVRTDIHTPLYAYVRNLLGAEHALRIWARYMIGRDGNRTVFWQVAKDGTIRAGKSIPYKDDGHRDKSDKYPANWLHAKPEWRDMYEGRELQQCYFGEHLLAAYPDAPVVIVESEKTAAVMSEVSHGWVWLASGGSCGLKNEDKNKALQGRSVTLLPDHGMYWKWSGIAQANGWEMCDYVERFPVFEGCDVLDLLECGALGEDLLKNCVLR